MSKLKAFRASWKKLIKPLRQHKAKKLIIERKITRAGTQAFGKNFKKTYQSAVNWDKNVNRATTAGLVGTIAAGTGYGIGKRKRKKKRKK